MLHFDLIDFTNYMCVYIPCDVVSMLSPMNFGSPIVVVAAVP